MLGIVISRKLDFTFNLFLSYSVNLLTAFSFTYLFTFLVHLAFIIFIFLRYFQGAACGVIEVIFSLLIVCMRTQIIQ